MTIDITLISVAVLGLLGTVLSAYLTNRTNIKNQKEFLKLELDKIRINSEVELNKIRIQNQFEIQHKLIDYEIKQKSLIFANYSYCASRLKYTGHFYRSEHYEYLKTYNETCTIISSDELLQQIKVFHNNLNKSRSDSLAYDEQFGTQLNLLNDLFSKEIQLCKLQLSNTTTQEQAK